MAVLSAIGSQFMLVIIYLGAMLIRIFDDYALVHSEVVAQQLFGLVTISNLVGILILFTLLVMGIFVFVIIYQALTRNEVRNDTECH